jgi:hypothetical protein
MTDGWYYIRDGQSVGPVSRAQLVAELLRSPSWHQEHVWKPGYPAWQEAGSVDELSSEFAQSVSAYLAQDHRRKPREASRLVKVLVYSGLAMLGIISAVIYHTLF